MLYFLVAVSLKFPLRFGGLRTHTTDTKTTLKGDTEDTGDNYSVLQTTLWGGFLKGPVPNSNADVEKIKTLHLYIKQDC